MDNEIFFCLSLSFFSSQLFLRRVRVAAEEEERDPRCMEKGCLVCLDDEVSQQPTIELRREQLEFGYPDERNKNFSLPKKAAKGLARIAGAKLRCPAAHPQQIHF